jgi:hypothetical protein
MSEPTAPDATPAPAPAPDPAVVALREEVGRILGDAAAADPAPGVPAWRVDAAGVLDAPASTTSSS